MLSKIISIIFLLSLNTTAKETSEKEKEIYQIIHDYGHSKSFKSSNGKIRSTGDFQDTLLTYETKVLLPVMINCLESDTFFIETHRYKLNKPQTAENIVFTSSPFDKKIHLFQILDDMGAVNSKVGIDFLEKVLFYKDETQLDIVKALCKAEVDYRAPSAEILAEFLNSYSPDDSNVTNTTLYYVLRGLSKYHEVALPQIPALKKTILNPSISGEVRARACESVFTISDDEFFNLYDDIKTEESFEIYMFSISYIINGFGRSRVYEDPDYMLKFINLAGKILNDYPEQFERVNSIYSTCIQFKQANSKNIMVQWYEILDEQKDKVPDSLNQTVLETMNEIKAEIDNSK